jgi:hypothetical protein
VRNATELSSPRFIWQMLKDIRDTLFSIEGLTRSLSAITGTAKVGIRFHKDGSWETTTQLYTGHGGYVYIAREHILGLRNQQLDIDANLQAFADILRFAHEHSIDTRIFITPEHIFMIDVWIRLGYGELWSEFHRSVVAVNNAVAVELGVAPFPMFGFNQMEGAVNEPIRRAQKAGQSMFSDGSHFRPALGKQIMAGVWTEGSAIGYQLDADSVEAYLSRIEQLRLRFERDNAKATALLRHEISPELD